MRQAIVTGATGFIGSAFVKYLTDRSVQVLALGRRPLADVEPPKREFLREASYVCLDMREISSLPNRFSEVGWQAESDAVFFNLAWGGVNTLSDLNVDAQMANVVWSMNALHMAQSIGCSRFIQVGTMEEAFTYKYLTLDWHHHGEYNRHVVYSAAKIAAKNALTLAASCLGIDFIYALHSHVMGPLDNKDSFLQVLLTKLLTGQPLIFSSGEQMFDVISVTDCVEGYFLICTRGLPGKEYWVGSGDPRPLWDYIERMHRLHPSGQELQFGRMPYNDVKLSADDFSIAELQHDTGYRPTMTYEDTVQSLYMHVAAQLANNHPKHSL